VAAELWWDDHRVRDLLDDVELLQVAVATGAGPHVTPVAFHRERDRLWFVVPRRSVKARAILADHRVGGLVLGPPDRPYALLVGGRARIADPLTARGLSSPIGLLRGAAGYLGGNDRHVIGAVRDHPAPTLALSRVAVEMTITRVALLRERGVTAAWGRWPTASVLLTGSLDPPPALPRRLPGAVRDLLAEDTARAALGWSSPVGPVALPAMRSVDGLIHLGADALTLCGGLSAGRACLTVERSGHRLDSKRGFMLRGPGRARSTDGTAVVTIRQEHLVWWHGESGGTLAASRPSPGLRSV